MTTFLFFVREKEPGLLGAFQFFLFFSENEIIHKEK
jgi:hypothetical protein